MDEILMNYLIIYSILIILQELITKKLKKKRIRMLVYLQTKVFKGLKCYFAFSYYYN